ncbi:MAG: hypothetical protein U0414_35505 [Polyangiaceae bacterium]
MVELVAGLRAPVIAACAVYGLAALLGRVLDAGSLYVVDLGPPPNASGWSGWAPFLSGLALVAALATIARRRILATSHTIARRVIAGPLLIGVAVVASAGVLAFGYRMSAAVPRAEASTTVGPAREEPAPAVTDAASASPPPSASASSVAPLLEDSAPEEALRAAIDGGAVALTELSQRFPKDPRVLRPLAVALGKERNRSSEMLRVLDTLFVVSPVAASDAEIYALVRAAVLVPATQQRALDVMKTTMGTKGADLLFDLVLNEPLLRERARTHLETAEVQRNFSPSLAIAYELFIAPTCVARLALLPQAVRDGDERTLAILTQVTARIAHNCGPKRNRWCPALCDQDTPRFEQAMKEIQERLDRRPSP